MSSSSTGPGTTTGRLPKGKLEPGESWQTAALREVEEETGLRCELGEEVGRTHYVDRAGRDKEVRYFLMSSDGEAVAQNEVDEVRWVALEDAAALLTYERDGELLAASSLQHAAAATAESKEEVPRDVPRTIRREMA